MIKLLAKPCHCGNVIKVKYNVDRKAILDVQGGRAISIRPYRAGAGYTPSNKTVACIMCLTYIIVSLMPEMKV